MEISHQWTSDQDGQYSGQFFDDEGKLKYEWDFSLESNTMNVRAGLVSRPKDLSGLGIDRLEEVELRERLIELAAEIGEKMREEKIIG